MLPGPSFFFFAETDKLKKIAEKIILLKNRGITYEEYALNDSMKKTNNNSLGKNNMANSVLYKNLAIKHIVSKYNNVFKKKLSY